jgi:hypothetical protein
MPVYHFTFHAYRNWRPDHPRGYVRKKKGVLPPDPEQARKYDERAKGEPVIFDEAIQRILIRGAKIFATAESGDCMRVEMKKVMCIMS